MPLTGTVGLQTAADPNLHPQARDQLDPGQSLLWGGLRLAVCSSCIWARASASASQTLYLSYRKYGTLRHWGRRDLPSQLAASSLRKAGSRSIGAEQAATDVFLGPWTAAAPAIESPRARPSLPVTLTISNAPGAASIVPPTRWRSTTASQCIPMHIVPHAHPSRDRRASFVQRSTPVRF